MSYTNSTTIDQQFEDRFNPIERTLQIWGVRAFPGKGEHDRDEALQKTRIVLWQRFTEDQAGWSTRCAKVWVAYARKVYQHAILHRFLLHK